MNAPARTPARKVGFVLLSSPARPMASTRIAALQIFDELRRLGFEPEVLYAPATGDQTPDPGLSAADIVRRAFDLVVFQKVHGPQVLRLALDLKAAGVPTVFLVCDIVEPAMCAATSATVAVTAYLGSLYPAPLQPRIHVVHDGIEHPGAAHVPRTTAVSAHDPLRAVLVSSEELIHLPALGPPPRWLHVTIVGDYPPLRQRRQRWLRARWVLQKGYSWPLRWQMARALLSPRISRVVWTSDGVYEQMARADIGVLPIDTDDPFQLALQPVLSWMLKSENRLTLKMAAGLPVVATPIPSYEALITQGVDGYLARTPADWRRALTALRDPAHRAAMGAAARQRVLEPFSRQRQAEALAKVFERVLPNAHSRVDE